MKEEKAGKKFKMEVYGWIRIRLKTFCLLTNKEHK
jgi:hypothetical protein